MRIHDCRPASAAMLTALSFTMVASAELRSIGTSELDMHLPGGTAGVTVDGKSSELVVSESGGVVTVTAKLDCVEEQRGHLSCIKTGNGVREKQLWKYLGAGKFHDARLSINRSQLRMPHENEEVDDNATGTFSLHGIQRPLEFRYTAERTSTDIRVHGQFSVNLKDFNIKQPSYAGVQTGIRAEIKVHFTLRDS